MASEISELVSLIIRRGVSPDEIRQEVTSAIREAYQLWTHSKKESISVEIEYLSSSIRIYIDGKDCTPPEFSEPAQHAARRALLNLLEKNDHTMGKSKSNRGFGGIIHILFWFYNFIYILFTILFVIFLLNESYLFNTIKTIGAIKVAIIGLVLLVPYLTVGITLRRKLYKNTGQVSQIFFLFEIPIIAISLFSFNILTNAAPSIWITLLVLMMVPFYWLFEAIHFSSKNKMILVVSHCIKVLIVATTVYIGLILAFFLPLITGGFIKLLWKIISETGSGGLYSPYYNIFSIIMVLVFGSLIVVSIAILLTLPYVLTYIVWKSVKKSWIELELGFQKLVPQLITSATVISFFTFLLFSSYQGDILPLINQLVKIKSISTFEERAQIAAQLIPEKENLRRRIQDGQNAHERYVFIKEDKFLEKAYAELFGFNLNSFSIVQDTFDLVAYPFTYSGPKFIYDNSIDNSYRYVFGQNTSKTESISEAQVKLENQRISATSQNNGLFAHISIEQTFSNTAYSDQEVIYEFSLPSGSVITDLKLGNNLEYKGRVAPKGAAAKTYQREVNKMRDPALLEQTGPRQYRLRIYPIPAKMYTSNVQNTQKVQFGYLVPLGKEGYALPSYTKKQNIEEKRKIATAVKLNGTTVSINSKANTIPTANAAEKLCNNPIEDIEIKNSGTDARILYTQAACSPLVSSGLRLALIYDVSAHRKNTKQWQEIQNLLTHNPDFFNKNTVDLYYFNDLISSKQTLRPNIKIADPVYFGEREVDTLPPQINENYSAVLLLTDNEFIIPTNLVNFSENGAKIIVVYENNKIPAFTQQTTYTILETNTKIEGNVEEALIFAIRNDLELGDETLLKTPYWNLVRSVTSTTNASEDQNLQELLTSYEIQKAISTYKGFIDQNPGFADMLYQKTQSVTHLSSLIALVNGQQELNLYYDSQKYDRYTETSPAPPINITFPQNAMYGFSDADSMNRGILNLFLLLNVVLIGFAGFIYGIRALRMRRNPITPQK